MVHRPFAARARGLQHPAGAARPRRGLAGRPRGAARRDRAPARGAAHHVPGGRWPPGPGDRARRSLEPAAGRPLGPPCRGPQRAGAAPRPGRGRPPVRPCGGAAAARHAAAARPGRARAAARHAPHRLRRLVDGGAGARDLDALRRRPFGPPLAASRAAGPVRGLRRLAARLAARRDARAPALLLAAEAGRPAGHARPADRPAAAIRAESCRRAVADPLHPGLRARAGALRPPPRGDPLHGPPRRFPGAPVAADRPGGSRRRLADRQPQPGGDRAADRLLRQYPGAARRLGGGAVVRRAGRPGPADHPRGLRPSGPPLRAAGRGAAPGAPPRGQSPLPGPVRRAERPDGGDGAPRPGARAAALRDADGTVRPRAQLLGLRRGAGGRPRLQRRAVRRADPAPAGGPPRTSVASRDGGRRTTRGGGAAARGRRGAAAPPRVERHRAAGAGPAPRPRDRLAPGGAVARRDRRRGRRRSPDLQ